MHNSATAYHSCLNCLRLMPISCDAAMHLRDNIRQICFCIKRSTFFFLPCDSKLSYCQCTPC